MITQNKNFFITLIILTSILFSSTNFVYAYSWDSNLNNELIGYWGMNEGNGTNVAEEVYGINNATIQGNVTWKSGINGTSTGDYNDIGDTVTLSNPIVYNFEPNDSFSVSFWVNKTTIENDPGFIMKQDAQSRGWIIREVVAGTIAFQLTDTWATNYFIAYFPNTILPDGNWHHYVFSYNGSEDYNGVRLYKDGIEINQSGSVGYGILSNITNPDISLHFGGWDYLGVYNQYPMKGKIDEIGIWNRILNSSEVQQLYNNGTGITYTSNFTNSTNPLGAIQWENESILNVNSSNWWNFMNGFNATHFVNSFNKLTISETWLSSFISSLINYNYIFNLGFYPSSNPSNFYNVSTLPPQTGTSFTYYNITTYDRIQTSTSANITILALPLTAGKNISIECNLLVDSAATNTGIQLNSTLLGTSSRRQVIEYYTSATAQAICQGANETLQCLASNSAGTITTPTRISIYTVQSSNGFFILDLKSKVLGSAVYARAGSWCRSIEL